MCAVSRNRATGATISKSVTLYLIACNRDAPCTLRDEGASRVFIILTPSPLLHDVVQIRSLCHLQIIPCRCREVGLFFHFSSCLRGLREPGRALCECVRGNGDETAGAEDFIRDVIDRLLLKLVDKALDKGDEEDLERSCGLKWVVVIDYKGENN